MICEKADGEAPFCLCREKECDKQRAYESDLGLQIMTAEKVEAVRKFPIKSPQLQGGAPQKGARWMESERVGCEPFGQQKGQEESWERNEHCNSTN